MARQRIWEAIKKAARDVDDQFWKRTGPAGAAELAAAITGSSSGNAPSACSVPLTGYEQTNRNR